MVHYSRKARKSGVVLDRALSARGFMGEVKFGYGINKREALLTMAEAGVPVPRLYDMTSMAMTFPIPIVGRPDYHSKGRGYWLCNSWRDVVKARRGTGRKAAATHFMEFVEHEYEFRVHVVDGQSIKISQKPDDDAPWFYPHDFHHKKTLRRVAKEAVEALELDFGAVDILWSDVRGPVVLEVNAGPCLTDKNSDTLERYVEAFVSREE